MARSRGNLKHGLAGSKLYHIWVAMIQRCTNPKSRNYANYGARGITVCDEWRSSFEAFRKSVGDPPVGYSLDRIDNNLGYRPGNVRWANRQTQGSNKRNNRLVEYRGERVTIPEAARIAGAGVDAHTARCRIMTSNWPVAEAVETPLLFKRRGASSTEIQMKE